MPNGKEHAQVAMASCRAMVEGVSALSGADEAWRQDASSRLQGILSTLEGLQDRFFLRSKLCLPFAARCARGAEYLANLLPALEGGADAQAPQRVSEALGALEQAVKLLDQRSSVQDMAIT